MQIAFARHLCPFQNGPVSKVDLVTILKLFSLYYALVIQLLLNTASNCRSLRNFFRNQLRIFIHLNYARRFNYPRKIKSYRGKKKVNTYDKS